MSVVINNNLNQLLAEWPMGHIYSTAFLHKKGYSDQQLKNYLVSGWLERVGVGAYKKANDPVEWQAGLAALQEQLELPVQVGGKTALGLLGKSQYLELGQLNVSLYGPSGALLPTWFKKYSWSARVTYQQSNLFAEAREAFGTKDFGYTIIEQAGHNIILSSAERAILEYLNALPSYGTYQEAFELVENLTSMRSQVLQNLLESCKSVKVKRLFLHLAEKVNHPWFQKLQPSNIDLGSGKRVIFKNGKLDPKYKITVPMSSYEE